MPRISHSYCLCLHHLSFNGHILFTSPQIHRLFGISKLCILSIPLYFWPCQNKGSHLRVQHLTKGWERWLVCAAYRSWCGSQPAVMAPGHYLSLSFAMTCAFEKGKWCCPHNLYSKPTTPAACLGLNAMPFPHPLYHHQCSLLCPFQSPMYSL